MSIDLNADVGEGLDEADAAIVPLISSANIACGGHAGDADTMSRTVALCREHGVAIGAHPGFPDRAGFGRRDMDLTDEELRSTLREQLDALGAIVSAVARRLAHVKPHGALYTRAAAEPALAALIVDVVAEFDASLVLVGLAGSALLDAGRAAGLAVAAEGFADRAYEPDGRLLSRGRPGAVLADSRRVAMQAVSIARDGRVALGDGRWIPIDASTICLHGDSPQAANNAMSVQAALAAAGVTVARLAPQRR